MMTTVMFVADSVPLVGVSVRLAAGEGDEVYVTDSEGKIEFDLDLGTHTFSVLVDDEWVERTIQRQGHAPLFVVNVRGDNMRAMTTLNTLQIDLGNLVGDRYVFETVLGRGGMGVVVKAIDRMLNRPVAIKMLSDELRENEEAQQIFLVEARNLATLSHPNLVAIHDILNVGGRVLMVFEYVLGENVEITIKKKKRLEQKDVLRIAIQLTRCVSYLHEHDLIHRDLKPANIIMQADGTLKLIDFGLARSLNELYVRGTRVRGTPAYMAPEQIQGIHLTTATDIYQLGISMYEMLKGGLPFTSGDMAYAHVHLDPPPLAEAAPEVDPELARLVHACLEKQPRNRPASAELLLEQLQQIYARIASSGESQQFQAAFERSHSGPIPSLPSLTSRLAESASEPSYEIIDVEELSFAEEVVGGSNRGLAAMAVVGILALFAATAVMLTRGQPTEPPPAEPIVAATTPVVVEPEPVAEETPPEEETSPSLLTARGLVGLSIATATGQASGMASADMEPPKATSKPRPSRTQKARVASKPKPKTAAPAPKSEPEPINVEKKTTAKAEPEKKGGLLSVDDGASKGLLPVSN